MSNTSILHSLFIECFLFIAGGFSRTLQERMQRGSCWLQQTNQALILSGKVKHLRVKKDTDTFANKLYFQHKDFKKT